MTYLKPLDGIRAIAIIAVLVFHISPTTLKGGFTGVDVFFVLSGFLITSLLLDDLHEGRFSIREFYLRRIQRLLPNIIVTVLAVLVLWTAFLPLSTARATGSHGLWTLFNASNIYIWRNLGSYWGNSAEWAPLTHTWSLGIEEQFYLFFPCSLLLLVRFQPDRLRFWLTSAMVLSFGACLYGSYYHHAVTFYLLPTRVWELLLGALIAAHRLPLHGSGDHLMGSQQRKARTTAGWIGILMIGASFLAIGEGNAFPGWVCLLPTVGTALLLLSVADGETTLSRWLSSRFMVRTGKLSYSLYLWHWPLITFGKIQADLHGLPKLAGSLAGGVVGIILAWIAYVCVEQPLRDRGPGRRWRIWAIAAGFALVALFSNHVASRPRVADPAHLFDSPTFSGRLFDAGGTSDIGFDNVIRYYDVHFPPEDRGLKESWRTGGIIHPYGGAQPEVVVLGSSHALMYSKLIDNICLKLGISVSFLGVDGGAPAFFEAQANSKFPTQLEAQEFDDARRRFLREWRPKAVFVIDRWDVQADAKVFETKFRSFLGEVGPLVGRVIFVSQVPVHRVGDEVNLREVVTLRMDKTKSLPRLGPDLNDELRRQVATRAESLVSRFDKLRILRADIPFYQNDGSIRYAAGRSFFYADDDHLSDAGTEVVRALFERAIIEAHSGPTPGNERSR